MLVWVYVHIHVHVCRGQRATFGVDSKELPTLVFEINLPTGLENTKQDRLASQQAQGPAYHHPSPLCWNY